MLERRLRDMEWNLPSPKWIFVFNILLFLLRVSLAKTLAVIYWDKNSNFGTEGLFVQAEINDIVKIECPKTPNTTTGRQFAQYLTFTQVSAVGFRTCNSSMGMSRRLLTCNRPFEDNSYLLLFHQIPPYPGGLVFVHDTTYYFITTSDGLYSGVDERVGGLCESHHMKVMVRIMPRPTEDTPTGMTARTTTPRPAAPITTLRPTTQPTTQPTTTTATPTRKTVKTTQNPLDKTPRKKNPNPQSQDGDNGTTTLRHSPLLILICLFVSLLRWTTTEQR